MRVNKSTILKWPPAWNIKHICQNKELYQESLNLRKATLFKNLSINGLADLHKNLSNAQAKVKELATQRNKLSKAAGTSADNEKLEVASNLKLKLKTTQSEALSLKSDYELVVDSVPNLIAPETREVGEGFKEIGHLGPPPQKSDDARCHTKIARELGILDLSTAARVSGSGFYYLLGQGVQLEQALIQYALNKCHSHGFKLAAPPALVRPEFTTACGFRPRGEEAEREQVYMMRDKPNGSPLSLIATAEIPLASFMSHKTIPDKQFDAEGLFKMAGVSRSYRVEAGSRGVSEKGLYRVHEFAKVEMFLWSKPDIETSTKALQTLLEYQKELVDGLDLPARIIRLGPDDLGAPAYEKFDIEAWMPGKGDYGEVSSASNCTDFQSRRLFTLTENGEYVHTLNATALAVPRVIIAILENNWDEKLRVVRIPKVLQEYMKADCISVPDI